MKREINKSLFRQVERAISAEPDRFDMGHYIEREAGGAPCGTTACIAGWAIILDRMNKKKLKPSQSTIPILAEELQTEVIRESDKTGALGANIFQAMGAKVLGITIPQSRALFYADNWPKPYATEFHSAETNAGRVKVAIRRIERFIETKGKE